MIKKINTVGYMCKECGLEYGEEEWADKCEKFCKENNACSVEITKHALNKEQVKKNGII